MFEVRVVALTVVKHIIVQSAPLLTSSSPALGVAQGWVSVPAPPGSGTWHLQLLMFPTEKINELLRIR